MNVTISETIAAASPRPRQSASALKQPVRLDYSRRTGAYDAFIRLGVLQQREDVLRILVGDAQHGGAGLHQDLLSCEVGAFGREVGVLDRALSRGEVGHGVRQGIDVGVDGCGLEGAQPAAELADLVGSRGEDLPGQRRIGGQRGGIAGANLIEGSPSYRPASRCRRSGCPGGPAGST